MGCNCGKPKCNGKCGCNSPKVLQINNPAEYITFHKVSIPAAMGDSTTNPPAVGKYKNVLLYYEADQTSWLYSTDGIPTKLTNGITNYEDAINLPKINGNILIGDKTGEELGLQDKLTAGENIQISDENVISATDTTYTADDGIEINSDNEISAKIGRGLEFNADGEINVSEDYIIGFDTVADMQSSTNLVNGSFAQTLGYYTKNDGGGATYKIRNITNDDVVDDARIIALNDSGNNLIAELVFDDVDVNQFGAKGDGITDDSTKLQNAISTAKSLGRKIVSSSDKTYLVSYSLELDDLVVDFNNSTIKTGTAIDIITINSDNYYGKIENIVIDMNSIATCGIRITKGRKKEFNNITIINNTNIGVDFVSGYEVLFHNSHISGNSSSTSSVGIELRSSDSHFTDVIIIDCNTAIKAHTVTDILTRVHAWILSAPILTNSKFIDFVGSPVLQLTDCYSDTFKYTFYGTSGTPQINVKGLIVNYNGTIYNTETYNSNPVICYFNSADNNKYINITDSFFKGDDTDLSPSFTNTEFLGNYSSNTSFGITSDLTLSLTDIAVGLTEITNTISKENDRVTINALFSYDASVTSGDITIGRLNAVLKPKTYVNTQVTVTNNQWAPTTFNQAYLYISDRLNIKLPSLSSGTKYIHINLSYSLR